MRAELGRVLVRLYAVTGAPLTLLAAAIIALSACAGTASQVRSGPPDQSPKSLYPLAAGYAWSYDVETEGSPPVLAVARVARFDSGVASVVTGPEAEQRYAVTDVGIQRVGQPGFLLKAPIALGAIWESGADTNARVASVSEQVSTTAGNFAACVVVEEQNHTSGQAVKTTYCPGVGPALVVSQMEVRGQLLTVTARLRGFSVESAEAEP
ncbi:MAG TPA: hypothetical protein VFG30_23975 [Polyangiales bacterium]|nr:hypothetical protein [Polyangiales bacterium]